MHLHDPILTRRSVWQVKLCYETETMNRSQSASVAVCETLRACGHDVAFSQDHVALYLHNPELHLPQGWSALCRKLTESMQSQPGEWGDPLVPLFVRCMELHSYTGDLLHTSMLLTETMLSPHGGSACQMNWFVP